MKFREQIVRFMELEKARLALLEKEESELRARLADITKLELTVEKRMVPGLQPVFDLNGVELTQEVLYKRIEELADDIVRSGVEFPVLLGVMDGAFPFFSKLQEVLKTKYPHYAYTPEMLSCTSYQGEKSTGKRTIVGPKGPVGCRKIFLIEDLIESGGTLLDCVNYLLEVLGAESVEIVGLLNKKVPRENFSLPLNYVGFVVPDAFDLGFGMDWDELFRNLSGIKIKGTGAPTAEEREILDCKRPFNLKLQHCLAAQKAVRAILKEYNDKLKELDKALAPAEKKQGEVQEQASMVGCRDILFAVKPSTPVPDPMVSAATLHSGSEDDLVESPVRSGRTSPAGSI